MRLIIATSNENKAKEFKEMLKNLSVEVVSLKDLNIHVDINENGSTYEENSEIKARTISEMFPENYVIGDDSGLSIDALDGFPGLNSHRFLGEATSKQRCEKLLEMVEESDDNSAKFYCALTLYGPGVKRLEQVKSCINGKIVRPSEPIGDDAFAYDPIFYHTAHQKTWAQMTKDEKNVNCHRAHALRALLYLINKKNLIGG